MGGSISQRWAQSGDEGYLQMTRQLMDKMAREAMFGIG